MANPEPEIQQFVKRLILGTHQGKVKWGVVGETAFRVDTPVGLVWVSSVNDDGEHPYEFQIKNADNVTLARDVTIEGDFYTDWETDIEALFKGARNSALGVAKTLDKLSSALELPDLPPPPPADDDIPF